MKSRILILVAVCLAAISAIAADAPRPITVAILDFNSPYKVRLRNDIGLVSSLLNADLSSNTQFMLVERTELKKALKEQSLGLSGEVSPETAAKIGRLIGAKILITGEIFNVGNTVGTDVVTEGADSQVLIIAKIMSTETSRFFAQRVQGLRKDLVPLADDLSKKIAQTINEQCTNLIAPEGQSHEEYLDHIVNSVKGTNRPSVLVAFHFPKSGDSHGTANTELSLILQKAGFTVVDDKSEQKPDVEIIGVAASETKKIQGGMYSGRTMIEAKVRERRSGKILVVERATGNSIENGDKTAYRGSSANAVDILAEKILPKLAK